MILIYGLFIILKSEEFSDKILKFKAENSWVKLEIIMVDGHYI